MQWIPTSPDLVVLETSSPACDGDDQLFSWDYLSETKIEGGFVPYAWYTTKKQGVRPLAVTGVCYYDDQVLLGKRGQNVHQYPGCWEFVPAGGVSPGARKERGVDCRWQLLQELKEECGADDPDSITLLGLLQDEDDLVDMVFRLDMSDCFEPRAEGGEVSAFQWVATKQLGHFLEEIKDNLVPASRFLAGFLFPESA